MSEDVVRAAEAFARGEVEFDETARSNYRRPPRLSRW